MSSPESVEVTPSVTIQDLLAAGLHFGHQTKRWDPRMKRYIFDKRNGIHIIDLSKTMTLLDAARRFVYDVVSSGKKVLFVGTKKQAQEVVKEVALRCGQPYVVTRWLGGTLTNSNTVRQSIKRYRMLQRMDKDGTFASMSKKEVSRLRRELAKLDRNLCGIADMQDLPGCLFVVDVCRETIAVAEAKSLHIPVVAMIDTNCNPTPIDYPIPANDDAIRSIKLVVTAMVESVEKADREYAKRAAEITRKREEEAAAKAAAAKAAKTAAEQSKQDSEAAVALEKSRAPKSVETDESEDEQEIIKLAAAKRKKSRLVKVGKLVGDEADLEKL